MATLYVTEYASAGHQTGSCIPVAFGRPITNNNVTVSGTSAQSNAFNAKTTLIRVHTDVICSVLIGLNPTAVTNTDARMAANQTEYYQVIPGDRIAAITSA